MSDLINGQQLLQKMQQLERENSAMGERQKMPELALRERLENKEIYRNDYDYQFARRVELEQLAAAARRALDPDDQMSSLSVDEIAALQSVELRELRVDRDRLDWLLNMLSYDSAIGDADPTEYATEDGTVADAWRDAIDAAMGVTQPAKQPAKP